MWSCLGEVFFFLHTLASRKGELAKLIFKKLYNFYNKKVLTFEKYSDILKIQKEWVILSDYKKYYKSFEDLMNAPVGEVWNIILWNKLYRDKENEKNEKDEEMSDNGEDDK